MRTTQNLKDGTSEFGFPDFSKRGQVRGVFDGRYKFGRYFSALNYQRPTTLQDLLDNNDSAAAGLWSAQARFAAPILSRM
ncbi:hypothetical protein KFU94_52915 [Chloroflexi bacterium TSY]|nr:hypothetical protein [Chloroflexi bacterium TSY]